MKRTALFAVVASVFAVVAGPVLAADQPATAQPADQPAAAPSGDPAPDPLKSLNLGVAIGVNFNVGSNRVSSADVVNGVVRVNEDDNTSLAIVGEGHYFFHPGGRFLGLDADHWGVGPFFAAVVNESTLKSFGVGAMMGFKPSEAGGHAFTVGLGVAFTPDTKVLGDGVFANKPLPTGETTVRFKTTTATSLMLIVGTTF